MAILNLADLPGDPLRRLLWLSGVQEAVTRELDLEWRKAYFDARMVGLIDPALGLGLHSRKRVLAFTRAENEARGRLMKRWADGY